MPNLPDLAMETVPIASLTLDAENARTHSQRNLDSIAKSLKSFGLRKPIVVHKGVVVAGNGTVTAAVQLGWTDIAVVRIPDGWTDDMVKAYALADNRTAELAAWDEEVLLEQLRTMSDGLLEAAGFTEMDVKALEAIYGDIPEGYEGRVSDPDTKLPGKVISLHVDDDTWDRWQEAWKALDGDDSARVNAILDVLP